MLAVCLLVACRAATPHGGSAITWQAPVEIAQGGGTKGPWQQNDSNFDYVDDPSVALAADGSPAVVWADQRDKDVHFRRGTHTVNVSRSPAIFSWLPRIVLANDHVHVIWQEIVFSGGTHGGEIFFARSTDGGATFADPVNLSRSINGDGKGGAAQPRSWMERQPARSVDEQARGPRWRDCDRQLEPQARREQPRVDHPR